jgi:hypothetical protein
MQAKHTEKICLYCDQILNNEQELAKHHRECKDLGVANSTCSKCNEKFTAPGLRRHQKTCHGAREDLDCPECGMMFDSANGVKRHTEQEQRWSRRSHELSADTGEKVIALKVIRVDSVT